VLSGHRVEFIRKQLVKRFEYLDLIKESNTLERMIGLIKQSQEHSNRISNSSYCVSQIKKKLEYELKTIGLETELNF